MISTQFIALARCGVYLVCMVTERVFILSFLLASFFAVSLLSAGVVYAHGGEEHAGLASEVNVCHSLSEAERRACYSATCEGGVTDECLEDIVDAAVDGSGLRFANAVMADLESAGLLDDAGVSLYGLAQRIGEVMAQQYVDGLGPMTFMDCEVDHHYGCHYGYFEKVLSADGVSLDIISAVICDVDTSQQDVCYHRMGHMFLKHHNYSLSPALSQCDALPSAFRAYCWDGVFMENVNEFFFSRREGGDGFISDERPFAPCDAIDERYREQCFKNHGRYLIYWFEDAPFDVLDVCGDIEVGEYDEVCRHSIRDASSGVDSHHTHDDMDTMRGDGVADSRSWFQKLIDFVVGLFSGGGSSDRVGSDGEAFSRMFPDGVAPSEVDHSVMISYENGQFVPNEVRIAPGQAVLWMNNDQVFWPAGDLHPTHREYPGSNITKCHTDERSMIFDACEAMGPGAAYAFRFNEVGEWKFHDHINPKATGTVIVSR